MRVLHSALLWQDSQYFLRSEIADLFSTQLLAKGAISAVKDGRRFLYSPVLQQQEWLKSQSLGLLDRWFGGRLAPLVAQFASHRKLKRADIEALKRLLQEHDRG